MKARFSKGTVFGTPIPGPMQDSEGTFDGLSGIQIFLENKAPSDWSIWISPETHIWTNASQIFLQVLVYTGMGP